MLEYALVLTTECCQKIMRHLKESRGWSSLRIARVLKMPSDYVSRIEAGKQSLQVADLESLSKACRCLPMELVYNAAGSSGAGSEDPFLDEMVSVEVSRYRHFEKSAFKKSPPGKKRKAKSAA